MAPSTPPPPMRGVLAALTIASTASVVRSAVTTSRCATSQSPVRPLGLMIADDPRVLRFLAARRYPAAPPLASGPGLDQAQLLEARLCFRSGCADAAPRPRRASCPREIRPPAPRLRTRSRACPHWPAVRAGARSRWRRSSSARAARHSARTTSGCWQGLPGASCAPRRRVHAARQRVDQLQCSDFMDLGLPLRSMATRSENTPLRSPTMAIRGAFADK